ncbi:MAG: BON domain-containing protein [Gemmataceae bacterium]
MPQATLEATPLMQAFQQQRIAGLNRVVVTETDDEVLLTGTVPSFYHKQLAQESILRHLQGRRLLNQVAVVRA